MSGVYKQPGVRVQMPRHNEGSILRSPRDEDALGRQWVKARATTDQTAAMAEQVKQLQWQLNRLRKKQPMTPYQRLLMPFEIYRSPDDPNGAAADQKYKFRVHSGKISNVPGTSTPGEMQYVTGTDGQADVTYQGATYKLDDVRDESAEVPAYDGATIDFTVASGDWTWVWVDNTDKDVPTIATGTSLPDAFSVWSTDYVVVGVVDATSADAIYIKQYVRADIMFQAAGTGGGGVSLSIVGTVNGDDTISAEPIGGGDNAIVAIQPELRQITGPVDGWSYTDYSADGQERTATSGGTSFVEAITPKFRTGDLIPVWQCADTGIIGVTAITITGREWAKKYAVA